MNGASDAYRSEHDGKRFRNPAWMSPTFANPAFANPAFTSPAFTSPASKDPARKNGGSGEAPNRPGAILRWRLLGSDEGQRVRWPARIQDPLPTGDPWQAPGEGALSITFIGQSCFLIRLAGLTVITDPVFSERASPLSWLGPRRARPPGRALASLPPVDLVLLSHNHYDHLDLASLRALHRHSAPRLVTPIGNARYVARAAPLPVDELDWWQQVSVGPARITAIPARHFSARSPWDSGLALWSGFMLEAGAWRVLFAGDSGDGAHWQVIRDRLGPADLALLPIGAYQPRSLMRRVHMDPAEAVRAHLTLGARRSVGMHFGTFQLTDEAIDAPEQQLAAELERQAVPRGHFTTLGFGECRELLAPGEGE